MLLTGPFTGLLLIGAAPEADAIATLPPRLGSQIVGKWVCLDERNKDATVEFHRDGRLSIRVGSVSLKGKYRVLDDATLELELAIPGPRPPERQRLKVQIQDQEMLTTDPGGTRERFQRAR